MRDIILIVIVLAGCAAALKRPWIGVMLWTWLSIMNPHRYTYGFAYSAPLAAMAVGCTVLGLFMTRDKSSPFKGSPVGWFVAFMVWFTLSWLVGLDVADDYEQWKKVMKIDVMILVSLMLLHSRYHIVGLTWVCAGSLAVLGAKGGVFTLLNGGNYRVWGPPGSFIADNNEFALALVVTIPLLRFLQLQVNRWYAKLAIFAAMVFCGAAALGSQSRGALLAVSAMIVMLWWRGKDKLRIGILLVVLSVPLVAFMPDTWTSRMSTIQTYEEDRSAMGRISAWWTAWNLAFHYPAGVGFNFARPELFARFSPYPDMHLAAHSIYFQVLGNHGFIGLAIFLGLWITTWQSAGWLRTQKNLLPEAKWTADLGAMCQVALAGYAVGGAFLSLAYFDLPYNIMAIVVLTRVWVQKKSWMTEPSNSPKWMSVLGLSMPNRME
jgi:putative inorganic carbon (HCO3(-)) transporter